MKIRVNIRAILLLILMLSFSPLKDTMYFSRLAGMNIQLSEFLYGILTKIFSLFSIFQRLSLVILFIYLFVKIFLKPKRILQTVPFSCIFLVCNIVLIISSIANNVDIGKIINERIATIIIIFFIEYMIRKKNQLILSVMVKYFSIILWINLVFMILYPNGIFYDQVQTRYNLLGMDNQLTPILVFSCFIAFLYTLINTKKKIWGVQLCICTIANTVFAFSSTAMVAVIFLLIYILFIYNSKYRKYISNNNIILFYLVTTIVTVYMNFNSFFLWIAEVFFNKMQNFYSRTRIWSVAMEQVKNKLLLGYGYGHKVYGNYYSHNGLLELMLLGGLVLSLIYLSMVIFVVKKINPYKTTKLGTFFLFGVFVILVMNLSEAFLFNIYQIEFFLFLSSIKIWKDRVVK